MDEGVDLSALVGGLSPLIDAVKSNPGLLSVRSRYAQGRRLSGALSLLGSGAGEKRDPPPPPRNGRGSDRRRLLSALSPYLSPERQKALATLLPLLEAWESVAPLLGGFKAAPGKE